VRHDGVASNEWKIHEHIGMQIDAPSHFVVDGKSLDELPFEKLIAALAVVNIRDRAKVVPMLG
jgi:kynurenine formamidase